MSNDRPDQDPDTQSAKPAPESESSTEHEAPQPEATGSGPNDAQDGDGSSDPLAAEAEDVLASEEEKLTFAESERDPRTDGFAPAAASLAAAGSAQSGSGEPGRRSLASLLFAAVVGGIIATVLGIAYHASGIVPTRSEALAQDAVDRINALGKTVAALGKRVDAIEADRQGTGIDGLSDRIARLESVVGDNGDRLDDLEQGGAGGSDAGTASADDLNAIKAELARLESGLTALDPLPGTVTQLQDGLSTVETSVQSLDDRFKALSDAPLDETLRAVKVIAVGMLQQGADDGADFATDVAMAKALGLSGTEMDELATLAEKDVPTTAALQSGFPAVAEAILAADSGLGEDAGFFDQLSEVGSSLVTIRQPGEVEGDSVEAIVSRMSAAVASGDLTEALSERQGLPEAGQAASAAWAGEASDRVTIDKLVAKLAQSVSSTAN